MRPTDRRLRRAALGWAAGALLLLASCGGGGGGGGDSSACSVVEQQGWLRDYMNDAYFWYDRHPDPSPTGYATVDAYFDALLYAGSDAAFPADRWSYLQSTAVFEQFFGDGRTLGYGLFVAGLEVAGQPDQPLRVRYIEPRSPAAGRVERGDTVVSVDGQPASALIAANDFALLTPQAAGDRLSLVIRRAGIEQAVGLVAGVYALQPVSTSGVLTSPRGRRVGYLVLKDFVSQAGAGLATAFADFRAAGVQDLVLDLRYNGGGLVSVANQLASYVVGGEAVDQTFTALRYNDRHVSSDQTVRFVSQADALGLARVYVLAGERTCSASELVINGLKPFVEVVQIGGTSCGKPVGFLPQDHCGTTYSAVNFETVNADGAGRYWDGLAPGCAVSDDFEHALGDPAEGLTAAALSHADTGACPPAATLREGPAGLRSRLLRRGALAEPAEPGGMFLK